MPTAASTRRPLPVPDPGAESARRWTVHHLSGLFLEDPADVAPSPRFRGGQRAADRALAGFEVAGYAAARNEAYPTGRRAASGLSPYIRYGLLSLPRVWEATAEGPPEDVDRFHDELLWQEYARHWYARLGPATAFPTRHRVEVEAEAEVPLGPAADRRTAGDPSDQPWDEDMACLELTVGELEDDGWLVNQTRMWLASHWAVRQGRDWRQGEDYFFRHLLDGSRAANRLGWQWVTGAGSHRAYGFSRWQVERRAPGLCASCELGPTCPIDRWPDDPDLEPVPLDPLLAADPDPVATGGPETAISVGGSGRPPDVVWLTAESLGLDDPALTAAPDLPAVFVFDRPLLAQLRLSAKRLIFLVETLAELATHRELAIHLGDPVETLADRALTTTFAPVPGWRRRSGRLDVVELHPWPWLRRPGPGPISSNGAWRRALERVGGAGGVVGAEAGE